MTAILDDNIRGQVREFFGDLEKPVTVLFFGKKDADDCAYCEQTLQLITELAELTDKIRVVSYDLDENKVEAEQYHVDASPTMVITAEDDGVIHDYGIRFKGIPSGHEFTSLVNTLLIVSRRVSGLSAETRQFLKELNQPVHLQVFVTPTCPYCPRAVILAHQMALESPLVEAEMVEAMEFPELSDRFNVSGVPQTTINQGAVNVVGAAPESQLVQQIKQALSAN